MKDYFKYNEVKKYFNDFVAENSEALKDSNFRDDLHYHAFNTDYYIIGTYQAEQWLGAEAFNVIGIIKEYEESNFGELYTDLSDPEKVVNMYAYIVGEKIVYDWLQANPLEQEQVAS